MEQVFGAINQIGFVVRDLDKAIAARHAQFGIGPWTVFRNTVLDGEYRGQPTQVRMHVALGYQGSLQIELIEVSSSTPSPYADEAGPLLGPHHVAWVVDDLDAAVAAATRRGMVEQFRAGNAAARVAYLDCPGDPGSLYEFIEGKGMRAMIEAGIAASAAWDGRNPVTNIDFAAQP